MNTNFKTQTKNDNQSKIKQPHNILTPRNVKEFRENLSKYFVHFGDSNHLYVKNTKSGTDYIDINKLNRLDDLYNLCNGTPHLTIKINPLKDFKEFMLETNQFLSFDGYFLDETNYEIIENQFEFITQYSPMWIGIDNQIYREFLYLSLGDFSGYCKSL